MPAPPDAARTAPHRPPAPRPSFIGGTPFAWSPPRSNQQSFVFWRGQPRIPAGRSGPHFSITSARSVHTAPARITNPGRAGSSPPISPRFPQIYDVPGHNMTLTYGPSPPPPSSAKPFHAAYWSLPSCQGVPRRVCAPLPPCAAPFIRAPEVMPACSATSVWLTHSNTVAVIQRLFMNITPPSPR